MKILIRYSSFVFTILFLSCFITNAFALEKSTHSVINGRAVDLSVLDQHIKDIGLSGIDQLIGTRTIKALIELGGETEDEPLYSRSFNHYLNPINNTGYQGVFKSALEWSHSQGEFGSIFGGDYSWPSVRSYYLNALISPDKATRDNYFAYTFQGIGQLMHLVEDMSVPAHTRNDGHILYNYEDWVDNTRTENADVFNGLLSNPVYFSGAMSTYDPLFLDLAAFSNANFLTDDTIFSGFTYPRIEDTELWTDTANNRDYLRKLASSTGVQVDHLAASSWLYFYRLRYFPATDTFLPLGLDDKVYSDYAALLIPRAVGYSAGLINYFFRGQIDMEKDTQNAGKYTIKNLSSETMEGTFSLYYDDANGNRNLVQGADLSAANNVSIAPGASSASIPPFTEPTDAKEKGKYMLVFNGRLGIEEGAVTGKVVKTFDIGPYIKITEVKWLGPHMVGHGDWASMANWHVTFSLEGDSSTIVEVPSYQNYYGYKFTYSPSVNVNTELDNTWGVIMRWTLSNGQKLESMGSRYAWKNRVPHAYKWFYGLEVSSPAGYDQTLIKVPNGYLTSYLKPLQVNGSCWWDGYRFENGEVYAWLATRKIFYELGSASQLTGQKQVSGWTQKLITAFGYTQEELKNFPLYTESRWIRKTRYYDNQQGIYMTDFDSVSPNVLIGTYSANRCTGKVDYSLIDPLPFPDFGTDEVLYEISYNGPTGNVSWTLKLTAE